VKRPHVCGCYGDALNLLVWPTGARIQPHGFSSCRYKSLICIVHLVINNSRRSVNMLIALGVVYSY